jgi:hypothetical protein
LLRGPLAACLDDIFAFAAAPDTLG